MSTRIESIIRSARVRILRRMQDYGPRHRLTIQATKLSLSIQEKYGVSTYAD